MADGNMVSTSLVPVERPKADSVKSRFSDGGDFAKVLNQSGLLKPLKDMMKNVSSIADFVKAQNNFNEWSKEENSDTNGETLPKETKVDISSGANQIASAATDNMNTQSQDLTLGAIHYDMQSWFKEMKWKNKAESKWRTAIQGTLESMKKSGLLKTLFLLVTVGVVALITKVGLAVKSFIVLGATMTRILRVIDKIPLIGRVFTPIADLFGMATGKLRGLNRIFDALPKKFLSKLAPVFKFFGMGARFMKAIPVLGWVITGIMALIDGVKGFLNADEITGKISTFGDKMVAALSSILSGFTMGLIDSKSIAKVIEPLNILFNALKEQFNSFMGVIDSVVGYFKGTKSMDDIVDSLGGYIKTWIKSSFKIIAVSLPKTFAKVVLWSLKTSLVSIPKFFLEFVASVTKKIFGKGVIYNAIKTIIGYVSKLGDVFDNISSVVDVFFSLLGNPKKLFALYVGAAKKLYKVVSVFVVDTIRTVIKLIKTLFFMIYDGIVKIVRLWVDNIIKVAKGIKSVFTTVVDSVYGFFMTIKKAYDYVDNIRLEWRSKIADFFMSIATNIYNSIVGFFGGLVDRIKNLDIIGWLKNELMNMIPSSSSNVGKVLEWASGTFSFNNSEVKQESAQTDNGSQLSEAVVIENRTNKDEIKKMGAQNELLQKMVDINEQMYNRMMPQTVVAFS